MHTSHIYIYIHTYTHTCYSSEDAYGYTDYCDEMDLTVGMVFYQNEATPLTEIDQLRAAIEAIVQHASLSSSTYSAYANFSHESYNATFASAASKEHQYIDPLTQTELWRNSSYEFCTVDVYGSCSLMVVHLFGSTIPDRALTPFMYQLKNGSCANPFSVPKSAFEAMIYNPPTPIVENYFECTLSNVDAFNNAIGIASGNTSAYMPVIVLLLLPFIYILLKVFNVPLPKEEYHEDEYKQVGQLVMKSLLRASDQKTRGMKRNGIIMKLAKELQRVDMHGSTDRKDSDDSDSEDSSDGGSGAGAAGGSGPGSGVGRRKSTHLEEGRGRSGRRKSSKNTTNSTNNTNTNSTNSTSNSNMNRRGNPLLVRAESVRDCSYSNSNSPKPYNDQGNDNDRDRDRDGYYTNRRASKTKRTSNSGSNSGTGHNSGNSGHGYGGHNMNENAGRGDDVYSVYSVSNPMTDMSIPSVPSEPTVPASVQAPVPVPVASSIRFSGVIDSDDEEDPETGSSGSEAGPVSRNRLPSSGSGSGSGNFVTRNTTTGVELNEL